MEQLQAHLESRTFLEKRWWKDVPSTSDWERMFQVCEACIQPQPEIDEPISTAQWHDINKRYTASSARGPDGFSRRDLQYMPVSMEELLVHQLNNWDTEGQFPAQLHTGFVHPLPKREDSSIVGDFRPVIIYSMIYRSWASMRSRQILKRLSQQID